MALLLAWPALAALLVVLAILLDLPKKIYSYYRYYKLLRPIPAPRNYPPDSCHWLLGHIPLVYKQDEELLLSGVQNINKSEGKDGHLAKIWLGPVIAIIYIVHPKVVQQLLKEPKSELVYNMLIPWLGDGLLISKGEKWFRSRRLLTPAFHFEILRGYVPVYNSCLSVLLDKWTKSSMNNEPVKLFDSLSSMSLDIIMQCSFSFKSDCQRGDVKHPYVRACCELVHLCSDRIMNPLYVIDCLYWLSSPGRKTKRLCDLVHHHAENIIAQRKEELERVLQQKINNDNLLPQVSKTRKYLDFLDILLTAEDESGGRMSDLEIRNEVDTFMFEGHDTTTSGMSWTLYCLAQHPEHQEKIREEVRNVLMGREELKYKDLKELKYTTWCIKEALRLYPPVFSFFRKTTDEVVLNNYLIPKDTILGIETFLLHHNAHVWEDPFKYDPSRFHPANMEKHGPYDYIPFSAGSRNCIGQNFALNEMRVVIGTIVNRFSLKVDETHKVEIVPRVVLRTTNDIKVFLEPLTE